MLFRSGFNHYLLKAASLHAFAGWTYTGNKKTAMRDTNGTHPSSISPADDFYACLPFVSTIDELTDASRYQAAPDDWLIFITDVRGSTAAVAAGRYKEVNTIGAASIVSAQNACKGLEFPFVFGGDGASLLVPPSCHDAVVSALIYLSRKSREDFGLELRVGCVPVGDVHGQGKQLLVG